MSALPPRRPGLRVCLAALVLALATTVSGCVRLPESGPVVETTSRGESEAEEGIYIDPRPPEEGATPPDIVKGFLDAMTATPLRTTVAKQFLTTDAQASWDPKKQTVTYADTSQPRGNLRVSVHLSSANHLDSRGAWQGHLPGDERELHFPMELEDGEWRIARAPDALIVPESWFEQRFRQVSLYFFDPTAQTLVPEPVYVPRGDQLATSLVRGLLRGPGPRLDRVSRSFIPAGLTAGLSVPVSKDGVADIAMKGEAGPETEQAIELMLAQFAWTLRQEPSIRAMRLSVGGQQVQLPGGVSEFSVQQGAVYDPSGFDASPLLYGLRAGRVVSGTPESLSAVAGPMGRTAYGVSSMAVSIDGSAVVGVSGDGHSLLRSSIRGDGSGVREVVSGAQRLLQPAWDFSHRVWLVDGTSDGARVSYLRHREVVALRVPGVSGRDVRHFVVSRDGSRLVAVVRRPGGDELMVSRLLHDEQGKVVGATPAQRISWEGSGRLRVRDVAWRTPTTVVVLHRLTQKLAQVRTLAVDGSPPGPGSLSTTLSGNVRSLASSPVPEESLYAVTSSSLLDLSSSDRGVTPLPVGLSRLDYVG